MLKEKNKLKVRFLGGVGEIGKNMTAIEYGDDIIVIDAGISFPTDDMPGVDLVIPDVSFLTQNKDKIRGLLLTHGHEDHIGGVPYLLKEVNTPIFGTKLTLTLTENKLIEHDLKGNLNCVNPGSTINLGCFKIEFINVNHSISGAVAFAITTPVGVIFHSGDYKIDFTPIDGNGMDLTRISEIGKKGVLLMMSDSTNIEIPGYTMSESVVGSTLDTLFSENADRRLIITTFASNVHRLQQILNLAKKYGRKVAFSGRSMVKVSESASKIGELNIEKGLIIDIDKINKYKEKEILIVSTGSQGEPMSALTRMATGEFNKVVISDKDTVVISASVIPGNERMIYNVINNLYKRGAEVVYESLSPIHVSGHACRDEIKLLHSLVKPKFFIPVHGEYRHLKKHVDLALSLGMKKGSAMICEIGDTVELTKNSMKRGESFVAGSKLVDGVYVNDENSYVIRDRIHLAEDGLIVVVLTINELSKTTLAVDVIARGVSLPDEVLEWLKEHIQNTLDEADLKSYDRTIIKNLLRKGVRKQLLNKTGKSPMILPIIVEV
ncbi:MAG: ribonuclease J [Clostridiales bacterium]|nr:ribonuclease J [Clostridiales bacterium]